MILFIPFLNIFMLTIRSLMSNEKIYFRLILCLSRNTCFGLYYFFPKLNSTTNKNPWEQGFLLLIYLTKYYLIISFSVTGVKRRPNINSWDPAVYDPSPPKS